MKTKKKKAKRKPLGKYDFVKKVKKVKCANCVMCGGCRGILF